MIAAGIARRSGGLLLHIKHRPPNGKPFTVLVLKHPEIPARRTIPFAGALVNHLKAKGHDGGVACQVDLLIGFTKFLDFRVVAKIPEPGKELFAALYSRAETRDGHNNLRMHQRREVIDMAS